MSTRPASTAYSRRFLVVEVALMKDVWDRRCEPVDGSHRALRLDLSV
jgi:hypothetical protein